MSSIRIHLEKEEYLPVKRFAAEIGESPELILYTALDRLMLRKDDPDIRDAIHETRHWREENLPLWADSIQEITAYESGGPYMT